MGVPANPGREGPAAPPLSADGLGGVNVRRPHRRTGQDGTAVTLPHLSRGRAGRSRLPASLLPGRRMLGVNQVCVHCDAELPHV